MKIVSKFFIIITLSFVLNSCDNTHNTLWPYENFILYDKYGKTYLVERGDYSGQYLIKKLDLPNNEIK